MMKKIAFIPARSGSKRVKDKNIRIFNGKPLLAHSIESALEANIFDAVVCATDSIEYGEIAKQYGAEVPFLRQKESSGDHSTDYEWILYMLESLKNNFNREFELFSILRPTSPFRSSETILRAWKEFKDNTNKFDSIRAVEKCSQHPGKMWALRDKQLLPILPYTFPQKNKNGIDTPWHSSQYCSLPEVFVQNASLEISLVSNIYEKKSISGAFIMGFETINHEGFDINNEIDFTFGEFLLEKFNHENKNA